MAITTEAGLHGSLAQPHLPGHYLSWGAIIAGGLCAAAISFVLLTFGSAIGLSAVSIEIMRCHPYLLRFAQHGGCV